MGYIGNNPPQETIPADDAVTTAMLKDDAVTADKLANSINTEITANTTKVTNATHTGDVTGATALTIATDSVDIAMLSATGTASSSTFLRGDNAWAAAGGGKLLQVQITEAAEQTSYINSTSWTDTGNMSVSITPASASNNIIVFLSDTVYIGTSGFHLYRIYETENSDVVAEALCGTSAGGQWGSPVSLVGYFNPSNTNALTFKTQMRRLDGSASSRMRDSQIEDSGNVFRIVAMEIEG